MSQQLLWENRRRADVFVTKQTMRLLARDGDAVWESSVREAVAHAALCGSGGGVHFLHAVVIVINISWSEIIARPVIYYYNAWNTKCISKRVWH